MHGGLKTLVCVCLILQCFTAWALEPYDPDTPRFILSTFRNADQTKLYLATSFDGRNYTPVTGAPVYAVNDGSGLRDPSIIRHLGIWYICYTAGPLGGLGQANHFRVIASPDLINWTPVKDVSMAEIPRMRYTWAPEWFVDDDGSLHVLVSVSHWPTNEHELFEVHPLDPADIGGEWSTPSRLHGPAFPEFVRTFSPESSQSNAQRVGAYDAYVLKLQGVYHLWYFNRATSSLAHATAPSLTGPFTATATSNLYGTGTWKEGQTMSHLGGASWRFTYANAITSTLYYIESSDDWASWTAPQLLGSPPDKVFNHGTVISNPYMPQFRARIDGFAQTGLSISFPTLKFNRYQIQWSADLVDWHDDSGEPIEGSGEYVQVLPPPVEADRRFYRVSWLPFW